MTPSSFLTALGDWTRHNGNNVPFKVSQGALTQLQADVPRHADSFYAECRLNGDHRLDYLSSFLRSGPSITALREYTSSRALTPELVRFLRRWAEPRSMLDMVGTLWLEFDEVSQCGPPRIPSVSALLVPMYGTRYHPSMFPTRRTDADRLASVLDEMTGGTATDAEREWLQRCALALPESSKIIHLSVMHGRSPRAVKVYLATPRVALAGYLRRLDWSGPYELVREFLARVATADLCGRWVYCDLNLANMHDSRSCTIGIAFSQQQAVIDAPDDSSRSRLLNRLVCARLCEESTASALRSWSTPGHVDWAPPAFRRWLDLKSVLHASGNVETKAYLGMGVRRNALALRRQPAASEAACPGSG